MDEITRIWPQWKVEEFIGKGSYGKVYKVRREEKGHISYAAVKVIEIPQDESEVRELLYAGMDHASVHAFFQDMIHGLDNEIKVMESLKTAENIVSIENYHFEERKDEIGWKVFIQMELLESLPRYIERMRKDGAELSTEEIVKLGINICSALECCEQEKIIHRDIKPDNIFRNKYGTYKLGDFGVARQMEKTKGTMSQKGTSMYMAPEIYLGSGYGHTVDIYSLGITMYKLLNAGRFPFYPLERVIRPGDSDTAMARRMRGDRMDAPCNADGRLAEIVLRACEFRPENRYQSASTMKKDLEHWLWLAEYGNVERKPEKPEERKDSQGGKAIEDPGRQEEPEEGTWRAFETKSGTEVKAQGQNAQGQNAQGQKAWGQNAQEQNVRSQNAQDQNTSESEVRKEQFQTARTAKNAGKQPSMAMRRPGRQLSEILWRVFFVLFCIVVVQDGRTALSWMQMDISKVWYLENFVYAVVSALAAVWILRGMILYKRKENQIVCYLGTGAFLLAQITSKPLHFYLSDLIRYGWDSYTMQGLVPVIMHCLLGTAWLVYFYMAVSKGKNSRRRPGRQLPEILWRVFFVLFCIEVFQGGRDTLSYMLIYMNEHTEYGLGCIVHAVVSTLAAAWILRGMVLYKKKRNRIVCYLGTGLFLLMKIPAGITNLRVLLSCLDSFGWDRYLMMTGVWESQVSVILRCLLGIIWLVYFYMTVRKGKNSR